MCGAIQLSCLVRRNVVVGPDQLCRVLTDSSLPFPYPLTSYCNVLYQPVRLDGLDRSASLGWLEPLNLQIRPATLPLNYFLKPGLQVAPFAQFPYNVFASDKTEVLWHDIIIWRTRHPPHQPACSAALKFKNYHFQFYNSVLYPVMGMKIEYWITLNLWIFLKITSTNMISDFVESDWKCKGIFEI